MKTKKSHSLTKKLASVVLAGAISCSFFAQGVHAQSFSPFAVGAELVKRSGKPVPKTEDICCMVDPLGSNYFMYHATGEEVRTVKQMARIYKDILRGRVHSEGESFRSVRSTLRSLRRRRGGIQRRLRAFRRVGRQCLRGRNSFNDRNLFQCEQFAAMNGAQAKIEHTNGTLSIILAQPITSFRGVNIFSGSKDDINRRLLTTLNDPNLALPTAHITFNLDQATLAMLQDEVDFNIAVLTGRTVYQGDFTELPNGCDDDGAGAGSGGGSNTPGNIPDEGYLATTLTNVSTGERASCAFEYSDMPLVGAAPRLITNGTYGRILCDFGQAVQVSSINLYVPPANPNNFGIVIDIASFFGGLPFPNWTYNMDGGAVSDAAENAVRALYGLDVEGVTPKNFEPLEITIYTNRGVYKGKYNVPV